MKIAVVGNGIAGSEFVRAFRKVNQKDDITVYAKEPTLTLQAWYPEVVIGQLGLEEIMVDLRPWYKDVGVKFVANNHYDNDIDTTVVATGLQQSNKFGVYGCGNIGDIISIRQRFETDPPDNLTIVGAGMTGIELAGVIKDEYPDTKVRVIEAMNQVLPCLKAGVAASIERYLTKKGINIYKGCVVDKISNREVSLGSFKRLPSDMCIWTAGLKPSEYVEKLVAPKINGYLKVDEFMSFGIWKHAIGDNAHVEVNRKVASKSALEAERQGRFLGTLLGGVRCEGYEPWSWCGNQKAMLTVGKKEAVIVYNGICTTIGTKLAYKLKHRVDKKFLEAYQVL